MCAISESEISVPIDISAATLRVASSSSGRILANEVVAAFVRNPTVMIVKRRVSILYNERTHLSDDFSVGLVVDDYFR